MADNETEVSKHRRNDFQLLYIVKRWHKVIDC